MLRVLCTVLVVAVLPATPAAQKQVITVDVDLVNIYFTVCNKQGRLVTNLDQANFAVYEDNSPQVITHFSRETNVPLKLVLLIDTSGSVRYKLPFEQDVAVEFLNSTLRPVDQASVVTFEDRKSTRLNSSHITISYAVF